MAAAGIALGSNLGDSLALLRDACKRLRALAVADGEFRCSLIYRSAPQDCPPGSPDFLNAVIEMEVDMGAEELLRETRKIEEAMGRERGERNAPRVIDLDLLYVGEEQQATDELELPHPRIAQRRFVLQPLVDIRPHMVLPGEVETVAEQLAVLPYEGCVLEPLEDGLE
ncbi:MAG: 2-amino-4-hydroxy-6-hydroxymethyldihydropteridine diphosphokinase [Akkermansiaceae bacterium]|nr:2-amino-4-hydroxy-6-hydroxymethyldihydropteridine diphosphokinase [Akkermansiaceae bacterium]